MDGNGFINGAKDAISDVYLTNTRNLPGITDPSRGSRHSSSGEEKEKTKI